MGSEQSTDDVRIIEGDLDFFAYIDKDGNVVKLPNGATWFKVSAVDFVDVEFTADQKVVIRNEKSEILKKLSPIEVREANENEKAAANKAKKAHEDSNDPRVKTRQAIDRLSLEIKRAEARMKEIKRLTQELEKRKKKEEREEDEKK